MIALPQDSDLRAAVITAGICSLAAAVCTLTELQIAPIVWLFIICAPLLSVMLWLEKDPHHTGVGSVQDWGMFMWLAWPILIPWYAFKARGRDGWRLMIGLIVLICSAYATTFAVASVAYGVRLAGAYLNTGG